MRTRSPDRPILEEFDDLAERRFWVAFETGHGLTRASALKTRRDERALEIQFIGTQHYEGPIRWYGIAFVTPDDGDRSWFRSLAEQGLTSYPDKLFVIATTTKTGCALRVRIVAAAVHAEVTISQSEAIAVPFMET